MKHVLDLYNYSRYLYVFLVYGPQSSYSQKLVCNSIDSAKCFDSLQSQQYTRQGDRILTHIKVTQTHFKFKMPQKKGTGPNLCETNIQITCSESEDEQLQFQLQTYNNTLPKLHFNYPTLHQTHSNIIYTNQPPQIPQW